MYNNQSNKTFISKQVLFFLINVLLLWLLDTLLAPLIGDFSLKVLKVQEAM